MSNITTIIVAQGEPKYIHDTVKSVADLSREIIIVDIGLSDHVKKKLESVHNVRILTHESVPYVERIREKTKEYAQTDYLLFMDPDEILPDRLAKHLMEIYEEYDYVTIPRKNMILKKWMGHSRWWPDYQTRLFKKDSVIWPTEIHAQPQTDGKGYTVESKEEFAILHHNYESLDEYLGKMTRYAKSDAENRTDYSLHHALGDGIREFISRYFAADGYKDGMHGFALSFLQLMYYPLVYFYYWEGKKYETVDEKEIVKETHSFAARLLFEINHWMGVKKLSDVSKHFTNKIINRLIK